MQIVFLIWPVLLLPVLLAWLTRTDRSAKVLAEPNVSVMPTSVSARVQKAVSHTPVYRKEAQRAYREMLELAAEQRRRESPAYRKAAQAAYREIQQMRDEGTEDILPSSTVRYRQASTYKASVQPLSTGTSGTSRNPLVRLG